MKCSTCIYRAAEFAQYACDYAYLVGETRKAQKPQKCTYYKKGKRLVVPNVSISLDGSPQKKTRSGRKTKYDYKIALGLYQNGKNDGEISRELGCRPADVRNWRLREGFAANTTIGKPKKDRE